MRPLALLRRVLAPLLARRQHRRLAARHTVDWHVFGSAVGQRSVMEDLSEGGVRVSSLRRTPVDSPLVIAIATPRGKVELHGRVAWTSPAQMGVRFTSPLPLAFL